MHSFYAYFKTKVFICKSYEELLSNYQKALTYINADEVIIQEIVPGHDRAQYSACFLFNVDHALVQLAVCRLRQHPIDFGNATTFAETIENDEIINYGTQLLKEIKFRGICEIEFKKDPRDGVFKLLEINPRSWKWHYIAEVSESPFLWGLYNYCLNKRLKKVYLNWNKACWQHQLTDYIIIIKLFLLRRRVKPIKCNNKIYAVFDKGDLKPYLLEKLYLPYLLITR